MADNTSSDTTSDKATGTATGTRAATVAPGPRRRRAVAIAVVAVLVAALVAGGIVMMRSDGAENEPASAASGATSTATVATERRDLAATSRFDGTLGYDGQLQALANRRGIVTRVAREGAVLQPGSELFRIGELPVFVLRGRIPAWRAMRQGMDDGVDVLQLERELVRLGLDRDREIDVDRTYDDGTVAAVRRLQERYRVDETGEVEAGQVVFAPGPVRVARRVLDVGAVAAGEGAPVLDLTSTDRLVTVSVPAGDAATAEVGDRVVVELPDGAEVGGAVSSVSTSAQPVAAPRSGGATSAGDPVIEVGVRIAADARVGGLLDEAPVQVRFVTDVAKDVLVVPVAALVALHEGGYAVERAGGSLVAVKPGLYADGLVAVESTTLEEGDDVVVPA